MSSELFLLGDARYLSGGFRSSSAQNYHIKPLRCAMSSPRVDEESVLDWLRRHSGKKLRDAINDLAGASVVSKGRSGYHSSQTDRRQAFLMTDDPLPSVGVELEFLAGAPGQRMYDALQSNWFSLERDGSLPNDLGHELVTVPLPASKYLNPKLWSSLHNLLAPYAVSAGSDATGFHVHVGLDTFDDAFAGAPGFLSAEDRRSLGALVTMTCYYALLPQDFLFDVYGRGNGPFRGRSFPGCLNPVVATLRRSGMRTSDLVAAIAWTFAVDNDDALTTATKYLKAERFGATIRKATRQNIYANTVTGHQTEVNLAPERTIEFRRGKGTLNPEAMLRMTDFSALCVRYAAHLAACPDKTPSTGAMMRFVADHATSQTLRELATERADKAETAEHRGADRQETTTQETH